MTTLSSAPDDTATPAADRAADLPSAPDPWWRSAVIYQIYPRSFADADGDGIGDLPGVISRLAYVRELGVDAIWLSPFYPSPQKDAGYDVSDYRDVDPLFGCLADADALVQAAHALGLSVILDIVPNHTSDAHAWFQAALAAGPGSRERARYIFRDGRGTDGELPPNDWRSVFGGGAWTRVRQAGDRPGGQWYLHLFDRSQPDLDWTNPEVVEEFESILRFWLDRGVDGFRVDVASGLIKADGLPDWDHDQHLLDGATQDGRRPPMWDQDGVHEIYRQWRRILDSYPGDRMMVAEAWVHPPQRQALYVRPDEMHQAFNFDYLQGHWDAVELRAIIAHVLRENARVGAPATWVLSNHDVVRHTSRLTLPVGSPRPSGIGIADPQPDEELGLRRGRAATLVMLALPGSAYLYQGEELGLPEHTTLPDEVRQDPSWLRTGGQHRGRDGCRVPLPWRADAPAFGFGPGGGRSWLPQPERWAVYAVDRQEGDPGSTLNLYRRALRVRREHAMGTGALLWRDDLDGGPDDGVLAFENRGVLVAANLGTVPLRLPAGYEVLVASAPVGTDEAGARLLPVDAAVWLGRREQEPPVVHDRRAERA